MVDKTLYLRYAPKSKVLILKDLYNTAQKSIRGIVIFVPFGNVPAAYTEECPSTLFVNITNHLP
jgi:hypothetical protein